MAIYHLSATHIQRSKGRSATASAAYRAAEKIKDERTGEIHDYTKKRGVEHTEILTPNGDVISRAELWNLSEHAEKRKDGTPAREYNLALPAELSADERLQLTREFANYLIKEQGCAVDFAIHAPSRGGDSRNYHAHILCTTRKFADGQQLGVKCDIELSDRDRAKKGLPGRKGDLDKTRTKWAEMSNKALERVGRSERVSHKSLEARGIKRTPTIHMGAAATAMERRGVETDKGDINRRLRDLTQEHVKIVKSGIDATWQKFNDWKNQKELARQKALAAERARQQEEERRKQAEIDRQKQEQERLKKQQEQSRGRGGMSR